MGEQMDSNVQINDDGEEIGDFFDLNIVKNYSFNKAEFPFKFEYNVIEPQPTLDSAFKIEPESATVGSRSSHEFKVTFDPSKGVGNF